MKKKPAAYLHILWNPRTSKRHIGSLGRVTFEPGFYVYVGSGGASPVARVKRHFAPSKRRHWHIDTLTTGRAGMNPVDNYVLPGLDECRVAALLGKGLAVVGGFGSSGCRCAGHLFHAPDFGVLQATLDPLVKRFRVSG